MQTNPDKVVELNVRDGQKYENVVYERLKKAQNYLDNLDKQEEQAA